MIDVRNNKCLHPGCIKQLFDTNGVIYESADKVPLGGCNSYRPDFVIDYEFFKVIIEVDENQHNSYECEYEQKRMINIYQDFGGIPILFIRYNPDSYKTINGIESINKNNRESILLDILKSLKNRKEWTILLSVRYLFYDGYDDHKNEMYEIDIDTMKTTLIKENNIDSVKIKQVVKKKKSLLKYN
jgi:very-short-patch-repair endonuclease